MLPPDAFTSFTKRVFHLFKDDPMSVELVVAGNILSANVDTPVTNIPSLNVENPTCVDTPDTFNWLVSVVASTNISLLKVDTPTNVETPDTFKSSNSVCPSTSNPTPTVRVEPLNV